MPSLSFPLLFQLASVLTMAMGLVKLLANHTGTSATSEWAVCGGVCLFSIVWLFVMLFIFKSVFGFSPLMGGTLIVPF